MYIMHENVSFFFQTSLHVELSKTYLQTWCTMRFSIFKRFFIKIPTFTPKIITFHEVDFGKHFSVERVYLKVLNNNKMAMYKEETIMYLRFPIF